MGRYLALGWVIGFLALRGLLLFDTPVDWLIILSGFLYFLSRNEDEFEGSIAAARVYMRNRVNYEGWFKNGNNTKRI